MSISRRPFEDLSVHSSRLRYALVVAAIMACLPTIVHSQDSIHVVRRVHPTPKKLSRSIVKSAKNSSAKPSSSVVKQDSPAISETSTIETSYVNPLFQELKIDGVDLGFSPIQRVKINTPVANGNQPKDHAGSLFANQDKIVYHAGNDNIPNFPQQTRSAATFQHQPLYFEEMNLERHGKSMRSLQPVVSGVRFFGTVPLLPYKMAVQSPRSHSHSHDPYPAGVPSPWFRESKPFSIKGITVETAMIAAAILIIP